MQLSVELESDGGWVPIGELTQLPGVLGVGVAREEVVAVVDEIALQIVADEWIEATRQGRQTLPVRIPIKRWGPKQAAKNDFPRVSHDDPDPQELKSKWGLL